MPYAERHSFEPDARFDGGDLDCGNGLLLLIRQHIDPMARGEMRTAPADVATTTAASSVAASTRRDIMDASPRRRRESPIRLLSPLAVVPDSQARLRTFCRGNSPP